jgi:GSH-dependent disulfide-bond oxidoreductase
MIDLYTAGTANGHRAAIALEESGLAYRAHKLDLKSGDQRKPEYLAINKAGAIPAIVDDEGPGGATIILAQSGAILLYLAEKTGKLMPRDPVRRAAALQWMMHACSDVAVGAGAMFQFSTFGPDRTLANVEYFEKRLYNAFKPCDAQLEGREFLADEYSLADIALYPVFAVRKALLEKHGPLPNVARWADAVGKRPAVAKGMTVSV